MARATIELKPRIMVGDVRAMGPGKADLLDFIAQTGSITKAAKKMAMSYRRAWLLVDSMNQVFKKPLVEAAPGGAGGGGAQVTEYGRDVLRLYREMQAALDRESARYLADFQKRF